MTVDVTVNQHVSCPEGDDAKLTIVISNGQTEPMSVLVWNTTRERYEFIPIVGPSATIVLPDDGGDPVQSGSYIVFVSGPSGSATADPFEIFQPDGLIVNTINPTCGVPTGTIEFTSPTNDNGIYTFQYSIDDGTTYQSSPSFIGLSSGDYDLRVEITSHTTCELSTIESINPALAPPDEPVLNPTQPTCDEPTGSIEVLSPIDPDFEYARNIMGPWQDATTFSGLAADNIYTIFVRRKSDNTCLNSKSVFINPAPSTPPAPVATTTDATCAGGGSIEVTSPLGAEYEYSIDGATYQASTTFLDVAPGDHDVTVRLVADPLCISAPTTVTVHAAAGAPVIESTSYTNPTTAGGSEGTITVNLVAGSGTPNYIYYLTDNLGNPVANSAATAAEAYEFTGLSAGSYTVYVIDDASCTSASITDIILEDPVICTDAEIVLTSGSDSQTICEGEAIESIGYLINGDFGAVNVAGLPAGVSGSLSVTTFTISGTPTETGTFNYTVTATGFGSCSGDMVNGTIIISEPLVPEFDPLGSYCVGEPADLLPAVSNNGVVGSWSPSTISTATAGVTNYTFTPDAGQCATTTIISITVNTTPTNVDAGPDVSICEGESTQLQGSADLPSNNNVLLSEDFTGVSVFGLPAGWSRSSSLWGGMNTSYAGGSAPELSLLSDGSMNDDVYRVVSPLINAADNQFLDLNFIHTLDHYNGAYRVAVQTSTDGVNWTNRWEFYWPGSADGDILPESVNVDLSVMDDESFYIAFTYTARLFNINYWAIDNVELTGLFAEPISVLWTPATGLSDPTILKPIASPTATTTYTLTIGIGGCENSDQVTVTVVDNVIPVFSLDPEYTYCEGDSPVVLPEISDNGISGTWSPSVISTETIGLTTYTFTPNPGECAYETSIDVLVKELPTATLSGGGDYCEGADPTGVDVQIDLTGEGPWLVRIDVDGDERDIVALSTPHIISNVGEGHFTMISVQDANCIGTVSGEAFVNEIPAPTATISGGGDYCAGTTPTGVNVTIDLTGTAPWSLVYAIDGVDQPAVTGIATSPYTIANATAGEYTLTSVSDASCDGTVSGLATVVENPLPTAEISGGGSYCAGVAPTGIDLTVTLTGTSPWTIVYSIDGVDQAAITGIATSPFMIEDATAGEYTLTLVEDATGCSGIVIGSAEVVENPLPTAEISGGGNYCAGTSPTGVDVTIDLTGEGPWTVVYALDGLSQPALIDILTSPYILVDATAGDYTLVSVVDANCTGTVSGLTQVVENPLPTAEISGGGSYCAGVDPTGIDLTVTLTGSLPWTIVYAIDGVDQPAVTGIATSPYTIANATAGEYTITSVEDATGCIGTGIGSATVIEHELPHAIMSGGGSYCAGTDPTGVDVQIDLTGEGPWIVRIDVDGDERDIIAMSTPHIISNVGEGHFTILSVSDVNCTGTVEGEAFVVELPLPEATISGGGEYCAGTDPTGVDVQINFSGIGPWDVIYAIDGVDQPEITGIATSPYILSNVTAGVYTLTSVSDENCAGTVSGSATVIENSLPTAEISGGGSYCAGTNPTGINVTIDLTGVAPWTVVYAIDGVNQPALIDIPASSYVLTDVTAGDYTLVSVTDANCTGTVSGLAEVVENPLPTAEISGGGSYCAGTDPTGINVTIDLTGEGPWTVVYAIDGASQPELIDILTSPYIIADATEGEYTLVSVVDANCTGTVNGIATVVENPLPTATMSGGGSYCAGTNPTNVDVSIELTGTGPWTVIYAVDGMPNIVSGINATPYVISDATKGEYEMIGVEDAFCSGTVSGSASVVEFETPTAIMSGGGEYCKGADPTGVDVQIDLTGEGPWLVRIAVDGDERNIMVIATPHIINDVGEGYFTIISVTDANCTGTVSGDALVVEIETAPPTGEANQEFCSGATIADIAVTGEAIAWYDAPGGSILADDYVLVDGETYYATQTAEGCESLDYLAVTVTVFDEIIVSVPVVIDAICAGETTGQVTVSASGGVAPYTFTLYNGIDEELATLTDLAEVTFTSIPAGYNFYIAVTDDKGCGPVESVRFNVDEPDPIQIDVNSIVVTDAVCFGQESGAISLSASGGTGDLYFTLTSGGVTIGATQVGSGVFINLAPGSYIVEISDDQGCGPVLSEELIVGEADPFTIELISDGNGNLTIVTDGGTPPFNFDLQFYDGSTWVDVASSTDPEFTGLTEGDYRVIATDNNGCTDTKEITILLYSFTLTATDITCFGEVDGAIRVNEVGVTTDPYSLDERKWFNELGEDISTYMMDRYDDTEGLYKGLEAGTYTLIGTKGGASHTETVIIIEPQALSVTYAINFDDVCSPSEAEITFTITGGTTADGFYNISWPDGAFTIRDNVVPNLNEGTYVFVITDDNGCSHTEEIELTFPEQLEVIVDVDNVYCNGDTNGKITVNATGTLPLTYKLEGPAGYTEENGNGIFTGLAPGEYTLTVTDDNNCSVIENRTITEPTPITFTLVWDEEKLACHDSKVDEIVVNISGGTGDYTIFVDGTAIGSTSLTSVNAGSYEVNVYDENGCSATEYLFVDGPKKPEYIDGFELPRCRELALGKVDVGSIKISGVATGTGHGDIADYNVKWYNMATNDLIRETGISGEVAGLSPGSYEARIEYPRYDGQEGYCTDTKIYDLEMNPDYIFSVDISGADNLWCYNSTDTLRVVMNSTIPLEIERVRWYNFTDNLERVHTESTPFMIENIDGDKNIILMVTTTDGCIEEATETVAIYDRILPFVDRDIHPFFSDSDLDAFRIIDGDRNSAGDSTVISVLANTEYPIEMYTKNPDYDLTFSWSPEDFFNPTNDKTSVMMFASGAYENYLTGSIINTNNNKVEQYIPIVGLVQSQHGCIEEVNLKARILDRVRTSNVFSPNDDGINDIWTIPYSDIFPNLEIKIFNRWGHQVWSAKGTDAARGWNGRNRNGKELPVGTYYYVIKFNVDGTTKWKPVSGSVTIVR